jgi:hypothetical protein
MYTYISYMIWFESLKSEALKLWWTLLYLGFTTKLWKRFLPIYVTSSWILVLYDKERIWTLFLMSLGNHLFGQNIFSSPLVGLDVHVSFHASPILFPWTMPWKKMMTKNLDVLKCHHWDKHCALVQSANGN